jgi:hypothetical protein
MKDVNRKLFSGFPVCSNTHNQSENGAMSSLVEGMQSVLIARRNRLDKRRPVLLRNRSLGLSIEHIAQCCWRLLHLFLPMTDLVKILQNFLPRSSSAIQGGWLLNPTRLTDLEVLRPQRDKP